MDEALDLTPIEPLLDKYDGQGRTALIPALFELQGALGWLPETAVARLGRALHVPLAEIYGVIEFYAMLYPHPTAETIVRVCTSPMCAMLGGEQALRIAADQFDIKAEQATVDGRYMLEESPCLGLCNHAPAALVGTEPVGPLPLDAVDHWIKSPQTIAPDVIGGEPRWLTARCGLIEPTDLESFVAQKGYEALRKALKTLTPEQVVQEVKASGLVGRGGAAFPTGLKWEYTAAASGEMRYIVCNADESEPGTFKDRVLLEGDPFSVLEGMTIAAYAVGAQQGYVYIRGEYPHAQDLVNEAIQKAIEAGYLGRNILGTDFSFDIEVRTGAGAYICGEETALFESIEGKRGFPRLKPPFPTTNGLFGQPTVINNVETLCGAAWILANGTSAYRAVGTEESPGSKLFCLSGDVQIPGVYEVPFGIPLGELIELAGGVRGELKAILLGGAAGAFAGPEHLDLPMSFEGLNAAGLPLGSGVVTLINEGRDLKAFLLSLAHFFAHESCGKCFPCQLGTQRQLEILERLTQGKLLKGDIDALQDVGFAMTHASFCGLGMTAATAILSAFKRWPELSK